MKMLRLMTAFGLIAGLAACGSPREDQQDRYRDETDSRFTDSVARDTATWGDTTPTTDSLASPSFP